MSLSRDQEALLELLLNVKEFLDDNGIRFYLFGGSCIGALRHRGFIPWDDDIDIILDRENYEKLIAASYTMPRDDMEFWCYEKSDDYFKPFGQFSSKKDTYFLKSRVFNRGLCMGTIIDVFVLDYVPSARIEEHKKNLLLFEDVMGFYRLHRDEISDFKEEYFNLVERERREGRRSVLEELQAKVEQFSEEESDLVVTRFWVKKLRKYKKEWFGEPRYVEFEGHMMPVPSNAEATLRLHYGYDWYNLPESEQRLVHNFYVNHDISNNNYVEDMEKFIDTDNIVELLEGRKHHQVDRIESQLKMQEVGSQLLRERLKLELADAIADRKFEDLNPIIKNIKDLKDYNSETAIVSGEFLLNWMLWLVKVGRFPDALKLADAFWMYANFTSELETDYTVADIHNIDVKTTEGMMQLLSQMINLAVNYQDCNMQGLEEVLSGFPEELSDEIADCLAARTALAIYKQESNAVLEGLYEKCDNYLKLHADNYEVLAAKADILVKLSRQAEADKLNDIIKKNSHNGLLLLNR